MQLHPGYQVKASRSETMPQAEDEKTGSEILIVDDNPINLKVLLHVLETAGHSVSVSTSGEKALEIAGRAPPDLVLLDVMMPSMDGYEVCRRLKQDTSTESIPVIFITANDQTEAVVAGFDAGGVDYIPKPFRQEEVLARVHTHLQNRRLSQALAEKNEELIQRNQKLEEEIRLRRLLRGQLSHISDQEARRWGLDGFIAESPSMQRILDEIGGFQDKDDSTVLIIGVPGTGKETMARTIHFGSARRSAPFVTLTCSELPQDVVRSIDSRTRALSALFGHVGDILREGEDAKDGCFQMADGGTLYLDEIGRMPLPVQGSLLRALQSGLAKRVGDEVSRDVNVRTIASSSVPLQDLAKQGNITADLLRYLDGISVHVPTLDQRREDIRPLAQHFLRFFAREMGGEAPELNRDVLRVLEEYSFPGNVRELRNTIERAMIESGGHEITPNHIRFLGA